MMNQYSHSRYAELVDEVVAKMKELAELKGGEYAGDEDRLANFRRNAEAQGLAMESIWCTYAAKHWDAIQQYVKDINTGRARNRLEPIEGRAHDLIVYLTLFLAILDERSPKFKPGGFTKVEGELLKAQPGMAPVTRT